MGTCAFAAFAAVYVELIERFEKPSTAMGSATRREAAKKERKRERKEKRRKEKESAAGASKKMTEERGKEDSAKKMPKSSSPSTPMEKKEEEKEEKEKEGKEGQQQNTAPHSIFTTNVTTTPALSNSTLDVLAQRTSSIQREGQRMTQILAERDALGALVKDGKLTETQVIELVEKKIGELKRETSKTTAAAVNKFNPYQDAQLCHVGREPVTTDFTPMKIRFSKTHIISVERIQYGSTDFSFVGWGIKYCPKGNDDEKAVTTKTGRKAKPFNFSGEYNSKE